VAAAKWVLDREWLASISRIALKEHRLRRNNLGEAGRALVTASADSAPRSSLGRLISRSRFRGSAMAGALTSDMCRHPRSSTNSLSVPSEILSARGAVSAATAGEA